jgi:hypothetical protein
MKWKNLVSKFAFHKLQLIPLQRGNYATRATLRMLGDAGGFLVGGCAS